MKFKNYLANRLINEKSLYIDFEKIFIMKMKLECGNIFTLKLETMFKDISIS